MRRGAGFPCFALQIRASLGQSGVSLVRASASWSCHMRRVLSISEVVETLATPGGAVEVLATGEIHGLANPTGLIARDGTERSIADSAAPIRDAAGQILGVVLVFRDVTQEREAQEKLRASEAYNRSIVESGQDCLKVLSLEGRLLEMSPPGRRMMCVGCIRRPPSRPSGPSRL